MSDYEICFEMYKKPQILSTKDFLEAGDVLESSGYEVNGLAGANHNLGKLYIALEISLQV